MQKTGESYPTARSHLLKHKSTAAAAPPPADYASLAGKSDAILKEKTGCTWERWVKAQTVTVGYERIKGLRAIGQRRDGSFEASKSKTFAVPLSRLYAAFHDPRTRARWLPEVDLRVRTATRDKSMPITWPDRTSVEVGFARRGTAKSQVALAHGKLPDKSAATRMKQYWAERLGELEALLSS